MAPSEYHRVFLLSPANASGERMQMLLRPAAQFDLARRLRAGGATLGEAFEFTSGLYFRGKLLYARTFARAPEGAPGAMTSTRSEEHTSELQSRPHLVCRLLL